MLCTVGRGRITSAGTVIDAETRGYVKRHFVAFTCTGKIIFVGSRD